MSHAPPSSGDLRTEWSKPAIFGAVLAVIGSATVWLVAGLFLSAIAAVCGHVARYETKAFPLRGRRLATFSLWLSYATMLFFPVLMVIAALTVPALGKWKADPETRFRAESRAHASSLFVACEAYARANRDHYPGNWDDLAGRYLPADDLADLLRSPWPGGKEIAFELVPHDRPVLAAIADSVVVIQQLAPSGAPEIAVVYANGRVASLHNPDYEAP